MTTRNRDSKKTLWDKWYCDASFYEIPWGRQLIGTKYIKCSKCSSNLLYQKDRANFEPTEIIGKCLDCQTEFNADQTLEMILDAEFGDGAMSFCLSCVRYTFICAYETCRCFACGLSLEEKLCVACGERLAARIASIHVPLSSTWISAHRVGSA